MSEEPKEETPVEQQADSVPAQEEVAPESVKEEKPSASPKKKSPKAHVAEYKKKVVKKIVELLHKYKIVGIVNMENLPAQQLQKLRESLRETVEMFMTKKRIMRVAFDGAKDVKGLDKLEECIKGMPALLFTNENPFKLAKMISKNKSKAPAKGGQTAPNDIMVPAGPTSFAPGPVIGELSALGLKTKVDAGKIAILEDAVVCKEGEVISPELAAMLLRLNITPMEIGLDLVAVCEDGEIFGKDILEIDEEQFIADLDNCARWALNLSVESAYPTKTNIVLLLGKVYKDTKGLALEANIMCKEVAEELLAKAEKEMTSLKDTANIDTSAKAEEKKEATEEKPAEEKKEVEKKEEAKEEKAEKKKEEAGESKEPAKKEQKAEEKPAEATEDKSSESQAELEKKKKE